MTANPIQPEINWNEVIKFSTEELRKYPNNSELYELRNKGEITNYISGDSNFLKLFVNKEVVVKGYLEGSFDNINIIKTAEIELK